MPVQDLMNVSWARSSRGLGRAPCDTAARKWAARSGAPARGTRLRGLAWPTPRTSGSLAPVRLPGLSFAPMTSPLRPSACVRGCRALGWRREAVVCTQRVRRDRAALRSAEPSLEPQRGPLLAPRRGAAARMGAATRRHLSRSLRRHARPRGDPRPRAAGSAGPCSARTS